MDQLLPILGRVVLYLVLLAGLIAIPLGLGGNFLLLGAAVLVGIATKLQAVTLWALLVMAGLVILGEVLEALLGSLVARRYGSSKWGMLGAFVGGIAGAIPGTAILPILGSVIGSVLGAAVGAVVFEWVHRRTLPPGIRAGWGAFLGKLLSTAVKMAIGLGIAVYLIVRTAG